MIRALYLGIDPPQEQPGREITHYPIIRIQPYPRVKLDVAKYTHLIFTSKNGVRCFFDLDLDFGDLQGKQWIAVGKSTARLLKDWDPLVATNETAEGVCQLLDGLDLSGAQVLWLRSELSRPVISRYLSDRGVLFRDYPLYTTVSNHPDPRPDPEEFDEIFFTSPSTVDAYLELYEKFPVSTTKLSSIGPVTERHLNTLECESLLSLSLQPACRRLWEP